MSGEPSTEIHTTSTNPFPVSPLSLDFGESSLEYICPVSPLQMNILLLLYVYTCMNILPSVTPLYSKYDRT
jgi:hypothetical protein